MNLFQGLLKIESIKTVARDTKQFRFAVSEYADLSGENLQKNKPLPFQAGQFVSLQFTEKAWRAYSIASTEKEPLIELVIRIIPEGVGSMILDKAKVGDTFNFKGPFGHFVLSENSQANLIFLGTGTGIAPLRAMIIEESRKESPRPMTCLYGGRNPDDIAYLEEMENWADNLNIKLGFSRTTDFGSYQKHAQNCRITAFLEAPKAFDKNSEFYICGNGNMVKSVLEVLAKKGVEKERIFMERFN